MADSIRNVNQAMPQGVQATGPAQNQPTIADRGAEVSQVLFDTRDESGLSDKAFAVLQKDWGRFVQSCNGDPAQPLPMEEANNDLFDYFQYMMKYGDKVKIGSTNSNMKDIISSDMQQAKQMIASDPRAKGKEAQFFATNMSFLISQDQRIPNDYCFLRFPAEEFLTSSLDSAQKELAQLQGQK